MFSEDLQSLATHVLAAARTKGLTLSTVESCTGGLIAASLTEIAGSSDVFDRGFITYSYEAKEDVLKVPMALIQTHGAVSHECAVAMVEGGLKQSGADIVVAVTGIAGPGGATENKPVGLVCFGIMHRGGTARCVEEVFEGDRTAVRLQTVEKALNLFLEEIDQCNRMPKAG